ncbi:MAG TPA: BrnA antitoxin family protein [Devosia sp.]|nr:BrnA antitoxin family protein [Devosia sp.]
MDSKKLPPSAGFDPADAELTDEEIKQLRPAREFFAERGLPMPKPLGRPKADRTKVPVTMRLDPDVLAFYKATGPGWQTRMGEVLAKAISKKSA